MSLGKMICVAAFMALMPIATRADETSDHKAILEVLKTYEQALNASDAAAVTRLFATDGVLMAPNSKPTEKHQAIQKVYEGIFKAVKLELKFEIDEVVPVSDTWGFARTRSKFTVKVVGNDASPFEDANQELFILQKEDGQWRIARYSYSSTNPAPPK